MPSVMANIGKSNLFWKQRVETLIEKYIEYEDINWKTVFLNLNELLIKFNLDYKKAFIEACKRGDLDNVELLIKSPKLAENHPIDEYITLSTIDIGIINASEYGKYSVVNFLLQDPAIKSYVVRLAVGSAKSNNHDDIVKLLSSDSRYDPLIGPKIIGKRPQFYARTVIVPS